MPNDAAYDILTMSAVSANLKYISSMQALYFGLHIWSLPQIKALIPGGTAYLGMEMVEIYVSVNSDRLRRWPVCAVLKKLHMLPPGR